ncbi:hypothetical protein A9975_01170 [Cupriavidus sp. UME77]|nr:hypothetical protein [Cupriavidus sp. UME77]
MGEGATLRLRDRLKMFQQTREQPSIQECFVNISPTLEANAKTTEIVEPRMSAFYHPARPAKTATVFGEWARCAAIG